jgi:hypothetical protein
MLNVVMLSVVMLSVVMLSVVVLNVVTPNVLMLSVVAPLQTAAYSDFFNPKMAAPKSRTEASLFRL